MRSDNTACAVTGIDGLPSAWIMPCPPGVFVGRQCPVVLLAKLGSCAFRASLAGNQSGSRHTVAFDSFLSVRATCFVHPFSKFRICDRFLFGSQSTRIIMWSPTGAPLNPGPPGKSRFPPVDEFIKSERDTHDLAAPGRSLPHLTSEGCQRMDFKIVTTHEVPSDATATPASMMRYNDIHNSTAKLPPSGDRPDMFRLAPGLLTIYAYLRKNSLHDHFRNAR